MRIMMELCYTEAPKGLFRNWQCYISTWGSKAWFIQLKKKSASKQRYKEGYDD